MFDTVLLLGLKARSGRHFQDPSREGANAVDWNWYMDKTFDPNGDVDALNQAAQQASQELNDPNYKVKLIVMFPGFESVSSKFGSLDGKRDLDLSKEEDRKYALEMCIRDRLYRGRSGVQGGQIHHPGCQGCTAVFIQNFHQAGDAVF